jgi:hypothetical protein
MRQGRIHAVSCEAQRVRRAMEVRKKTAWKEERIGMGRGSYSDLKSGSTPSLRPCPKK